MAKDIASCLNEHRVFKDLLDDVPIRNTKCMHLMTSFDDVLYVWNSKSRCINSVNVKAVSAGDKDKIMCLKLMPTVYFSVDRLILNGSGTIIAISGEGGLATVKLPDRWEADVVDVECIPIGQRVFLGDSVSVLAVRWHPGCPSDSLIAVLTTDRCLRLYSALDGVLSWCVPLSSRLDVTMPSLYMGETPIDFAFTLPEIDSTIKWPVLFIQDNGDVHRLTVDTNRTHIEGPLRVKPPAEDNYGLDASGITVLETQPPLVVIATSSGNIYHCLLLSEDGENVLHVVERLYLEAGLGSDDGVSETCPTWVTTDGPTRYLALTPAGLHSVNVPFAAALRRGDTTTSSQSSMVRSLLATALRAGGEAAPLLGLTSVDGSSLLVLLPTGKVISLAPSSGPEPAMSSVCDISVLEEETVTDEEPPLTEFVNKLLSSSGMASCPVLALPVQSKPQDWVQIVTRATSTYGSVLAAHVKVAAAINQRVENLRSALQRQKAELDALDVGKKSLRATAETIAERYEDAAEALPLLTRRADILLAIVRSVQNPSGSSLTAGDKALAGGLERARERLERLKRDHDTVKAALTTVQLETQEKSNEFSEASGSRTTLLYRHSKQLNAEIATLTDRVNEALNLADSWCPRSLQTSVIH